MHCCYHTSLTQTSCSLIDAKNARRYDDCLKYAVVSGRKALIEAGIDKERCPEGYAKLDPTRVGCLIGTGMGGLTVFQDGTAQHNSLCDR